MKGKLLLLPVSSGLIAFSIATGGGGDWTYFFVPFAGGDLDIAYHPYYVQMLLYPFQHFPYYVWRSFTLLILILVASKLKTDPINVLVTLPGVALIWAGQIDSFVIALAAFCISALIIRVGIYSFANFLELFCPVRLIPVTWLVYVLHDIGNVAFIVPITVLMAQFFPEIVRIIKYRRRRLLRDELET